VSDELARKRVAVVTWPTRILAAVDFSAPSRTALSFAARLARQYGAELHVMHAEHPLLAAAAAERGIDLSGDTAAELRKFIETAWPAADCLPQTHVVVGQAGATIANTAIRENADLIVVGARGMTSAQHVLIGSTTERVLRRASRSVFIVPETWTAPTPLAFDLTGVGPVFAAVDFRIPSLEAANDAAALAARLATSLTLVHVVPSVSVLDRWRGHAESVLRAHTSDASRQLECAARRLRAAVKTSVVVEAGDVAQRMAEIVHAQPRAILAVGRSVHADRHGAPGTNAYRMLTLARVPVLMHVARSMERD
jgi:nucleotide-binding universal stress UspA family protein